MTVAATRVPARSWLLRAPADDVRVLLFCLPYPGTGASMYHQWPRRIGGAEVCPVQLPGRESRLREPAIEDFDVLVDRLVEGLLPSLDRPFAFFGHCGSAFLGLEAALLLERRGLPVPAHLFVSAALPPHRAQEASLLAVPEDEYPEVVASLMRARGVEPTEEFVELALGALIADVRGHRGYRRERTRVPCPVTALGWTEDADVPPASLTGWADYGDVTVLEVPGNHWSFLDASPDLQEALRRALAPVAEDPPRPPHGDGEPRPSYTGGNLDG